MNDFLVAGVRFADQKTRCGPSRRHRAPPPYWPCRIVPSNFPYSSGVVSTCIRQAVVRGIEAGPLRPGTKAAPRQSRAGNGNPGGWQRVSGSGSATRPDLVMPRQPGGSRRDLEIALRVVSGEPHGFPLSALAFRRLALAARFDDAQLRLGARLGPPVRAARRGALPSMLCLSNEARSITLAVRRSPASSSLRLVNSCVSPFFHFLFMRFIRSP